MARCGNCRFFKDFDKVEGYMRTSHCLIRPVNYYGPEDRKEKPRKAFLPVAENDGACGMYVPAKRRKQGQVAEGPAQPPGSRSGKAGKAGA